MVPLRKTLFIHDLYTNCRKIQVQVASSKRFVAINSQVQGSTVGNVSDYICEYDCRSRGREFDLGLVPYFMEIDHEIIYSHSPPFR